MTKFELEAEERRREEDDRREERTMTFLAGLMQSVPGSYGRPLFQQRIPTTYSTSVLST